MSIDFVARTGKKTPDYSCETDQSRDSADRTSLARSSLDKEDFIKDFPGKTADPSTETNHILKRPKRNILTFFRGLMSSLNIRRASSVLGNVQTSFWHNSRVSNKYCWQLSNLEIGESLGQGSFGIVYQAKTKDTEVEAAVKSIKKTVIISERELTRVKNEFSCWRALSEHPNVIKLFAYFETDLHWCFVMEYVDFGSLSQILRSDDFTLTPSQVRRIAAQLAHAIDTLHKAGYLHRDISCSNVLLTPHLNCKLIDFGLSIKGGLDNHRCGSLAYMAPEVLRKSSYDSGADWWSFGIVVYTMLMGRTPLAIYARKKQIDLGIVSRELRYTLAKQTPIRISSRLNSTERGILFDILKEDSQMRLGNRDDENFDLIKNHLFFTGFNWEPLDDAASAILARAARHSTRG